MRNFSERLKKYPASPFGENRAFRSAAELRGVIHLVLGIDLRVPKVITCNQQPGGIMSPLLAVELVHGSESSRLLSALGDLLAELVDSPAEEVPERLGELLSTQALIREHMERLKVALDVAGAEMRR